MSDANVSPQNAPRIEIPIIGVVIVVLIGIFWYVSSERQTQLRRSASGFDGLHAWFVANGIESQTFTGGWGIDIDSIGLRLLPLFDTDVSVWRTPPTTKEELILQTDEYDITDYVLTRKPEIVPTLVILPKWRSGMRLTKIGHPALLIPQRDIERALGAVLGDDRNAIVPSRVPFSDYRWTGPSGSLTARLYAAQLFEGRACDPIIGEAGAMLLGECRLPARDPDKRDQSKVFILSDPDLLNTHGLRLGDNAEIAATLLPQLAGDRPILIDYSDGIWVFGTAGRADLGERSWEDLKRFFSYPFSILWASASLLMLVILWRAALRYGPILGEDGGPDASKSVAISARARLMRLAGQDGALVSDYSSTRLSTLAQQKFGPTIASRNARGAIMKLAGARNRTRETALKRALERIDALPSKAPAPDAISAVNDLETQLNELFHEP